MLTCHLAASGTGAFGGAFGTNQQQQQPAATGGGLFGQPQQSTGAFGTLGENSEFVWLCRCLI